MKKHFENSVLKYVICGFILFKIICTVFFSDRSLFLFSFGHTCPWWASHMLEIIHPSTLLYKVCLLCYFGLLPLLVLYGILLLINRKSAGFASVMLIFVCIADIGLIPPFILTNDLPIHYPLSISFNLVTVLMLLLLRRSKAPKKADAPTTHPA